MNLHPLVSRFLPPKTDLENEADPVTAGFRLSKFRLTAFTDGVLAIILTILVLGLKLPKQPSLYAFWVMRDSFLAYGFSFFWICLLWMSHVYLFDLVSKVDTRTVGATIVMLFFCSLVPYLTLLASQYFFSPLIQSIFGLCMVVINICLLWIYNSTKAADPDNKVLVCYVNRVADSLKTSLLLKSISLLVTLSIWPPATMVTVAIEAVRVLVSRNDVDSFVPLWKEKETYDTDKS